jgi:hypothetical protein
LPNSSTSVPEAQSDAGLAVQVYTPNKPMVLIKSLRLLTSIGNTSFSFHQDFPYILINGNPTRYNIFFYPNYLDHFNILGGSIAQIMKYALTQHLREYITWNERKRGPLKAFWLFNLMRW